MARKPRIEFEGAFYHVITRGNQRQRIFKGPHDFAKYLEILGRYKSALPFYLYAYVLMNNHVHLLIETAEIPLSKILQGINQSYTAYFNKTYRTVGHLFQGRYKAILCDRDEYLLSLVKYIHLNPLRARIAGKPAEFPWSSHLSYCLTSKGNELTDVDQVLRLFSEDKTKARKLFCAYMDDGLAVSKEDVYATIDQRVLGGEQFLDKVIKNSEVEISNRRREKEYSLPAIAGGLDEGYGLTLAQLRAKSKDRGILAGKKLFCHVAKEYGYRVGEIAAYMKKDGSVITRYLQDRSSREMGIDNVVSILKRRANGNKQV